MTSTTVSLTPFRDRHGTVTAALAVLGVTPPHGQDMAAVDDTLQDRLRELDQALAAPSVDDLRRDAARWVRGDLQTSTLAKRITAPDPDNSPRLQAAREAAQAAMVRDLDQDDWSTAALINASRAMVQSELENMAYAATASLEDLPEAGRNYLFTGQGGAPGTRSGDPAYITMLVDPERTSTRDIDAYREVAARWSVITGMRGGHQETFLAWDNLFQTLAQTRAVVRDGSRRDSRFIRKEWPADQYGNGGPLPAAVWMDYRGNVAKAFGVGGPHFAGTILAGEGKLEPLADPLGEDMDEYLRRFNVYENVTAWALMRDDEVAHKVHRSLQSGHVPATLPTATKPLYRHAGYASPEEALAAYLADRN